MVLNMFLFYEIACLFYLVYLYVRFCVCVFVSRINE